ncbi:hypothetical protein HMPREF0880_00351 [Yokenella regensburgei ATCC 43003]|nr:hypothetical protein HMPREF0880_00351 [Yokenella regensburgei ATCC 43003]
MKMVYAPFGAFFLGKQRISHKIGKQVIDDCITYVLSTRTSDNEI